MLLSFCCLYSGYKIIIKIVFQLRNILLFKINMIKYFFVKLMKLFDLNHLGGVGVVLCSTCYVTDKRGCLLCIGIKIPMQIQNKLFIWIILITLNLNCVLRITYWWRYFLIRIIVRVNIVRNLNFYRPGGLDSNLK